MRRWHSQTKLQIAFAAAQSAPCAHTGCCSCQCVQAVSIEN
jgi:hypothetical protein